MEFTLLNISIIEEWAALHDPKPMESYLSPNEFHQSLDYQYQIMQRLLKFYSYKDECIKAVQEIKNAITENKSLDQIAIINWVKKYKELGHEKLFGFGYSYLDYSNSQTPNLTIPELSLQIDRSDFSPIIQFWEAFQFLYWNGYDLTAAARKSENKSYYSSGEQEDVSLDLNKVVQLLYQ